MWEAPVAGGTATESNSAALPGGVGSPQPTMSPDGRYVLERQERFGEGFGSDSDGIDEFSSAAGQTSQPTEIDSSTLFGMTYGRLGDSAMVSHASSSCLQPPSWVCIGTARRLKLTVARRARTKTLASASKSVRRKGKVTLSLRPVARTLRALTPSGGWR